MEAVVVEPLTPEAVAGGRSRVRARVRWGGGRPAEEVLWFEVDAPGPGLRPGDLWLVALLPVVARIHRPLEVEAPVDAILLERAARVLTLWSRWFRWARDVPVEAAESASTPRPPPGATAAFFSGGVDSFFTALRPREHPVPGEPGPLDALLTVRGFDLAVDRPEAFAPLRRAYPAAAARMGLRWEEVATNLRATRWEAADWSRMAHGCALVAAGLATGRYRDLAIPASAGYASLHPWGSHPVVDPLLSSSTTRVHHDGAAWVRTEKAAWLADHPVALEHLRVCWASGDARNCGRCHKCVKTMLALEVVGVLHRAPTFPADRVDLDALVRMDWSSPPDRRHMEHVALLAESRGRDDVVRACRRARRARPVRQVARRAREAIRTLRRSHLP